MSRKFADFSFHRDNVFPNADEGSPKPMPPPSLPLMINGSNDSSQASTYENGNVMQSSERLTNVVVIEEQTEIPVQKMSMEGTEEASSSLDADDADLEPPKSKVKGKILFERGYSQIDWMKLTQSHPDLAGLKGVSNRRQISLSEVKQHKTDDDAWTILRGRVYNITAYMKFHPGGRDMLIKAAGRDCTSLFNKYHAWVNAEFLLEKCLVGVLEKPPLQE